MTHLLLLSLRMALPDTGEKCFFFPLKVQFPILDLLLREHKQKLSSKEVRKVEFLDSFPL